MMALQADRTERQKKCLKNWIKYKCQACIEAATGFGKTYMASMAISLLQRKYPDLKSIVIVPTEILLNQWKDQLNKWKLSNVDVIIINTAIKHTYTCDLLILDECHRYAADTFKRVFDVIHYSYVLGLTATLARTDGKEEYIKRFCPICDTVSVKECLANHWVSNYDEYLVLIDVDDIDTYKGYNKQFIKAFSYFDFDWNLVNKCSGPNGYKMKNLLASQRASSSEGRKTVLKEITLNAAQVFRWLQKRKSFIYNHPKKIEIAKKIMDNYPNKKLITFSSNIKMARALEDGKYLYTSKITKKEGKILIENFNKQESGHLHTVKKADEGLSVDNIEIAIIVGLTSSSTQATQRLGRVIRYQPDKKALIFNLILNNTVEVEWFLRGHEKNDYITIKESELDNVLNEKEYSEYELPLLRSINKE